MKEDFSGDMDSEQQEKSEKDKESGSYQYQLEMIKDLVTEYKKLPKPSINLITQYYDRFKKKLSKKQSNKLIKQLNHTLKLKKQFTFW